MKKMMAMLLASAMAAGTFTTTAFAYTGDDVQKNTSVSTAAQETEAAESANAGKTDNTDSIEIDPDMQVLPDGYEVSTDADYHDEDEDALQLPEDDGDEEVDVNEDYEAESDDEPV